MQASPTVACIYMITHAVSVADPLYTFILSTSSASVLAASALSNRSVLVLLLAIDLALASYSILSLICTSPSCPSPPPPYLDRDRHRRIPFVVCCTSTHSLRVYSPVVARFLITPLPSYSSHSTPPLPSIYSYALDPFHIPIPPLCCDQGSLAPCFGWSGICVPISWASSPFLLGVREYNFLSSPYP